MNRKALILAGNAMLVLFLLVFVFGLLFMVTPGGRSAVALSTPPVSTMTRAEMNELHHPGYSWCLRCNRTWDVVNGHLTPFGDQTLTVITPNGEDLPFHIGSLPNDGKEHQYTVTNGLGCFPLCDECWAALTPEQRLPYYSNYLFEAGRGMETNWPRLKAAVLAGK